MPFKKEENMCRSFLRGGILARAMRRAVALYRFNTEVFIAALWRQVDGVGNGHSSIEVVPEEILSWGRHRTELVT